MVQIQKYNGIENFYFLTQQGGMGYYNELSDFKMDSSLTRNLLNHSLKVLERLENNEKYLQIGKLETNQSEKRDVWNSSTIILEDFMLNLLENKDKDSNIEPFQKIKRRKSIFQGIETIIENPTITPIFYQKDKEIIILNYTARASLKSLKHPLIQELREKISRGIDPEKFRKFKFELEPITDYFGNYEGENRIKV